LISPLLDADDDDDDDDDDAVLLPVGGEGGSIAASKSLICSLYTSKYDTRKRNSLDSSSSTSANALSTAWWMMPGLPSAGFPDIVYVLPEPV